MSRTNRNKPPQHRAAREALHREWDSLPVGAYLDQVCLIFRPPPHRGGNMIMSQRNSHLWWDERYPSGGRKSSGRKKDAERRNYKRSERQKWRKEV